MTTRFFNNIDHTLFDKIRGISQNMVNLDQFCAAVGYFRASGYFKIRKELENVPVIRILICIAQHLKTYVKATPDQIDGLIHDESFEVKSMSKSMRQSIQDELLKMRVLDIKTPTLIQFNDLTVPYPQAG